MSKEELLKVVDKVMGTIKRPAPAAAPCKSCPYRIDVPSGIWAAHEYAKLPPYDLPTFAQPPQLFMCHQRDGCLCAGWLACHGQQERGHELLALRIDPPDPSAWSYQSPVPVFKSGYEAAKHGMAKIKKPGEKAVRAITRLTKKLRRVT